jgi:hypothetical protein
MTAIFVDLCSLRAIRSDSSIKSVPYPCGDHKENENSEKKKIEKEKISK